MANTIESSAGGSYSEISCTTTARVCSSSVWSRWSGPVCKGLKSLDPRRPRVHRPFS
jgi:hypothetical protein